MSQIFTNFARFLIDNLSTFEINLINNIDYEYYKESR